MNLPGQLLDWLVLLSGLAFLFYCAVKIKNEKHEYLENSKEIEFYHYAFYIPSWWKMVLKNNKLMTFKRTDTRYDWHCSIHFDSNSQLSPKEIIKNFCDQGKIEFDEEEKMIITESPENFFLSTKLIERTKEFLRVEGTATKNQNDRLYLDLIILTDEFIPGFLMLENHSSVLNGVIEGPYFEEVAKTLENRDETYSGGAVKN